MAENRLKLAQINAELQHVGGKAVAQAVDGNAQADAALVDRRLEGGLHPAAIHRGGGLAHPLRGSHGVGKQQPRMAVGLPPAPQQEQQGLGDRHVAILVALAAADVQAHTPGIDVADLQRQPLAQAQPGAVEQDEEDAIAELAHRAEEGEHLRAREHIRQPLRARRLDDPLPVPGPVEDVAVEELEAAAVDVDRAPGVGPQQSGEVDPQVLGAQVIGAALEEAGGAAHRAGVALLGLRGHALELQGTQQGGIALVETGLLGGIHGHTLLGR